MAKVVILIDGTTRSLLNAVAVRVSRPELTPVYYVTSGHVYDDDGYSHHIAQQLVELYEGDEDREEAPEIVFGQIAAFPYNDAELDEGSAIPPLEIENQYFQAARVAIHTKAIAVYVPGYDIFNHVPVGIAMAGINQVMQSRGAMFSFNAPYMTLDEDALIAEFVKWFPQYYHMLSQTESESEAARAEAFEKAGVPDPSALELSKFGIELPETANYAPDKIDQFMSLLPVNPDDGYEATDVTEPDLI